MPKFDTSANQDLEQFNLKTSHYGFSATRLDALDSSEYSLVSLLCDDSSSVGGFKDEMAKTLKKVIEACQKSPRADNLMLRFCTFADSFSEVHGFKRLQTIQQSDYDHVLGKGGMTALYDAAENGISATAAYGKHLMENDFSVNGIVFILTDGQDNRSKQTPAAVKDALGQATKQENLESIISVLVGVNSTGDLDQYLDGFKTEAGITQYVPMGDATPQKLAKLAEFVSKSISATSQSLGSGSASAPITF
jgi:uncharacterized protein YegL